MNHIVSQGDECARFFQEYIKPGRRILCIATLGFNDVCLHFPLALAQFSEVDFLFLVEERPEVSEVLHEAARRNRQVLMQALSKRTVTFEQVDIVASDDTANVAGRRAARACAAAMHQSYSDVIVDASSMSRGVCFPVVKYFFERSKSGTGVTAHVVTAGRNRSAIKAESTSSDSPQYVHGFQADMDTDRTRKAIKLWIPQLSENARTSLSRIQSKLAPDEACPILPFPSADPCRGDRLLKEFQLPILNEWNVNLLDVIYAHEADPMDVCATIMRIHRSRSEALAASTNLPAVTVLSPSGTRIGSVGMLLAAMEQDLPIMYEESIGYSSALSSVPPLSETPPEHLWHIWLRP
jgi:hypothetical protein